MCRDRGDWEVTSVLYTYPFVGKKWMKLIINIKCYCEFVICFYFCSGLTEHKNERKRKRQDFYSMAVVNDAYAIFHGEDFSPP